MNQWWSSRVQHVFYVNLAHMIDCFKSFNVFWRSTLIQMKILRRIKCWCSGKTVRMFASFIRKKKCCPVPVASCPCSGNPLMVIFSSFFYMGGGRFMYSLIVLTFFTPEDFQTRLDFLWSFWIVLKKKETIILFYLCSICFIIFVDLLDAF